MGRRTGTSTVRADTRRPSSLLVQVEAELLSQQNVTDAQFGLFSVQGKKSQSAVKSVERKCPGLRTVLFLFLLFVLKLRIAIQTTGLQLRVD